MRAASTFTRTPLRAAWREKNPFKRLNMRRPWLKYDARLSGMDVVDRLRFDEQGRHAEAPDLAPLAPSLEMLTKVGEYWQKFEAPPGEKFVIGKSDGFYFVQEFEVDEEEAALFNSVFDPSNADVHDHLEARLDYMEREVWPDDDAYDIFESAQDFTMGRSLVELDGVLDDFLLRPGSWHVERSQYLDNAIAVRSYADSLRERMQGANNLESFVPEVYGLVTRACQILRDDKIKFMKDGVEKEWGLVPRPVQILSAIAMSNADPYTPNRIIEQMTAEGKTITSALPIILHALAGQVHVMTHNPSLAERDREWLGPLYDMLGIKASTVGVHTNQDAKRRRHAYEDNDVLYGTVEGFGFDYLFGSMESDPGKKGYMPAGFAFIDEFDDRAKKSNPLIINTGSSSYVSDDEAADFLKAATLAKELVGIEDTSTVLSRDDVEARFSADYIYDEEDDALRIGASGLDKIVRAFGLEDESVLFGDRHDVYSKVFQALRAERFFRDGEHYKIYSGAQLRLRFPSGQVHQRDDEYSVQLIDQGTGHPLLNNRFTDGLHAALTAKEMLNHPLKDMRIEEPQVSSASITVQTFLRRFYPRFSAGTGTLSGIEAEVEELYDAECIPVPRHRKESRVCYGDRLFAARKAKLDAVAEEIAFTYTAEGRAGHLESQLAADGKALSNQDRVRVELARNANYNRPVLVGVQNEADARYLEARVEKLLDGVEHTTNVLTARPSEALRERQVIASAGQKNMITIATPMAGRGADIELDNYARSLGGLYLMIAERASSQLVDDQLAGRCGRNGAPGLVSAYTSIEDRLFREHLDDGERQYLLSELLKASGKRACKKLAVRVGSSKGRLDEGFTIYTTKDELSRLKEDYGDEWCFGSPKKMYDPADVPEDASVDDPKVMKKIGRIISRIREAQEVEDSERRRFSSDVDGYASSVWSRHLARKDAIARAEFAPMDEGIISESYIRSLERIPPHLRRMLDRGAEPGGLDRFIVRYREKHYKPTLIERLRDGWNSHWSWVRREDFDSYREVEAFGASLGKEGKIVKVEHGVRRDEHELYYALLDCAYEFADFVKRKSGLGPGLWEKPVQRRRLDGLEYQYDVLYPFRTPDAAAKFEELRELVRYVDDMTHGKVRLDSAERFAARLGDAYDARVAGDYEVEEMAQSSMTQDLEHDLTGEWMFVDYGYAEYGEERAQKDSSEAVLVRQVDKAYDSIMRLGGHGYEIVRNVLLDNMGEAWKLKLEAIDACEHRYANIQKRAGEQFDLAEFRNELAKHDSYIDGICAGHVLRDVLGLSDCEEAYAELSAAFD